MVNKMFDNDKKVIPYRIKQARISRGISMLELSELIGVTKQSISHYEMGKNEPSKSVLNSISEILKYPVSFFYKDLPPYSTANSIVFFRSGKSAKVKDLNAAKEKISIFREINDFLCNYVDFPSLNFPKIDYAGDGITPLDNDTIEEYARSLRECWKLGNGPIDNLINVVQKNGFMVSKMNLRLAKLDAFSVWYNNTPFIFLGGEKDSNSRVRFDIAHELGHLLMHSDFFCEDDFNNSVVKKTIEDEAHRFAGAFLLPKDTFSNDVFSTSLDHFIQLKSKWKVSISAMIHRCNDLNLLSINQIKYLKDQMTFRRFWRNEPLDSTMPVEKPYAHKQAIMLLLDNNYITPSEFVESIGCYPSEIEEYCFLDKGTLDITKSDNIISLKNFYNIS